MTKKNRTGLQSKISNIFAGVPIPKRKGKQSESDESKKKSDTLDLPKILDQESLVEEESPAEQTQDLQAQAEEPVKNSMSVFESLIEQSSDNIISVDQSKDNETSLSETENLEFSEIEYEEIEVPDNQSQTEKSTVGLSSEQSQDSESSTKQAEDKKTLNKENVTIPSIKEPITERKETFDTQKQPPVRIIHKTGAIKKDKVLVSRKVASKTARKQLKSKPSVGQPRKKAIITFVILVIVLILVLAKQFDLTIWNSYDSGSVNISEAFGTLSSNIESIKINWTEPPIYPDTIRDPMEFGNNIVNRTQRFVVNGISYIEGKPLVTIGKELKGEGDEIFGAKIIKITESKVEFERDGISWTQEVGE